MELIIVEKNNRDLYVYEDKMLLFYSTFKYFWLKRNVVKIYDSKNDLILELQNYQILFFVKYKIIFQNRQITKNITKINDREIFFDYDKTISRQTNLFLLNQNATYSLGEVEIAKSKQKMWNFPQKMQITFIDAKLEFLGVFIIHILATRTGLSSD
jgi:hypothetical protein